MNYPKASHWDVIMHILGYLKKALGYGILYKNHYNYKVEGFANAKARVLIVCRFTLGYYVFIGGNMYYGKIRNKQLCFNQVQSSNTRLSLTLPLSLCTFLIFFYQLKVKSSRAT